MNRRDFLLLKADQRQQLVELSCERLYMQYLDAQAASASGGTPAALEPWEGEPPAELAVRSTRELFDDLARELEKADVVRIVGAEWLAAEDFRRQLEQVISAFRERGGRVE